MPLVLGIGFFLVVQAAGYCVLRLVRVDGGLVRLGLAAPVGLAILAMLTTWSTSGGFPVLVTTLIAGVPVVGGTVLAFRSIEPPASMSGTGLLLLLGALAVAVVVMGIGFAGVDAPLSTHDGSQHVETIDAARRGLFTPTWYPPGLYLTVAAFLQLMPWIDSAEGSFGASLGLSLIGIVAVFGLAYASWRSAAVAGAGALAVALTFQYPYHFHFWSGWPLAAAIPLFLAVWALAIEYVRQPSARLVLIGGLIASGIVLIHGTEAYSAAIGLLVVLLASWRRVPVAQVSRHLPVALVLALVLAAPYLPTLFHWAAQGGAAHVRDASAEAAALVPGDNDTFATFGTGVGFDLPLRVGLMLFGAWQAVRCQTGRTVVSIGAIFAALALGFVYVHAPLTEVIYAATFPWAQSYRLLMIVAIAAGLLQGLGGVAVLRAYARMRSHWSRPHRRRTRRVHALISLLTLLISAASVASLGLLLLANARVYASTSTDDKAAMSWLRTHARPGEVVANDGFADAGIWAPFKAGAPVLVSRLVDDRLNERDLVVSNIGRLELAPESEHAACALGVQYVFHGSKVTLWENRHFPPLADLQRSPGLQEVFASGDAVIFKVRLACDG
jgi:hypothetical protein